MNLQDCKFIIAYNFINPDESKIVNRQMTDISEEILSEMDLSDFIGQGIWICKAEIINSEADSEDLLCKIEIDDEPVIFQITKILKSFPIIEGEISAGIYQFYQSESEYYEIKNALALSEFFDEEPNFSYEDEKFIGLPNGISLHDIKENRQLAFYQKHPLTFFDIYCPLCQQKVMTYEVDSYRLRCESVSLACVHFICDIVSGPAGYEIEELNDLNINYKITGENLYFETSNGWQKPVVYIPSYNPANSYWSNSPDDSFVSHFLFVESEPKFWIK